MTAIRKQIEEWRDGLLTPNKNDVLLNLLPDVNAFAIDEVYQEEKTFSLEENPFLRKIYKQHQTSIKESGSPIFGIAKGKIAFEFESQNYEMPFLLADAFIQRNRFNGNFEIKQTEDFYINPLLLHNLGIQELPDEIEAAAKKLDELGLKSTFENGIWIANFHPHRFVLQKEFDAILNAPKISESLKSLFGESSENVELAMANYCLFPSDVTQQAAIEKVKTNNTVIQGPPGTGKSQVITNLIGKSLGENKSTLLVAEKSVALQVIYDKMKEKKLHHYSIFYHHELKAKQFVRSIQSTWNYIESLQSKLIVVGEQSNLLEKGLDLTLDRLRQKDLIGGISFSAFKSEYNAQNVSIYVYKKPTISTWKKDRIVLGKLEKDGFPVFGSWLNINFLQISFPDIQQAVKRTIQQLKSIKNKEISISDIEHKIKLNGLVSLFYHNDQVLPVSVFESESRLQKQFLKLFNSFITLTEKETELKAEEGLWDKAFSLTELNEYILALSNTKKYSIKSWMTRNKLSKFTHLNMLDTKKALENLVELNSVKRDLISTKEKLRKLKLPDEIAVLNHINYAINRINSVDKNDFQNLLEMSENERLILKNSGQDLSDIQYSLRHYFSLNDGPILDQLEAIESEIPLMIENLSELKEISIETKSVLQETQSIAEANSAIYNSHWKDFKGQFPTLAEISGKEIKQKIENIIESFIQESIDFGESITQEIKRKFEQSHTLLQTPASKLSDEEKQLKKDLRKGKSILVKAFDKKRVFPSVRELLKSEARLWIQLLHPVFLCSPYSVAKSLPIDYQFDLAIFDEASQIPLSHIVGTVQRSKRIVISGDQQQMAPQFYFQKKALHQSDALHHASFYWQNVILTHHYRSVHPNLIEYSNQYFYENQLKTFPTPFSKKPIDLITTDGIFNERTNEKEAEIVSKIIIDKIKNEAFNFGLVAFSQTQLKAILEKIPTKYLEQLENKDSIFVQSLENVQGDQCEHLIISLGYAKNENGDFHKRFGPLNQEQGHRRLNVLMSRAISKITFVRSVTSADFSISSNEGVESLRKLMMFLEQEENTEIVTHFKNGIERKEDILIIKDIASSFKSGNEVVDFYRTSVSRGWKVEIAL
ncbi:DEAD/DEAH box helicase [Brumimicrobium mesophilum]|uniref:DEAD/DEAH box helicase n=1 Tax=Brumimicrobium mesophilum TaxID=392717 RepID=UPI000D13EFC5|nr:AAA domain-containing protein [Brumimicrobium mesophilum]